MIAGGICMNQEKIGKFIAILRREHSLTQKELAQRLGVSDKTISKWETGRGLPEISIMRSLCETLEISMNELLSGDRLDESSYRKKAEENIETLLQRRSYKKVIIHIAISTTIFLVSFLMFPLAAERFIPPLIIPIVLFWSVLLVVANFIAGITYGVIKKVSKLKLLCITIYDVLLIIVLITLFTIATVVFSVS